MTHEGCHIKGCTGWSAEVERHGRWDYYITLRHGLSLGEGSFVWGRKRTERKARRLIAKSIAREQLRRERFIVTAAVAGQSDD